METISKKVALINPGKNQEFAVNEPLNLGFIAGFLEQAGIEVKIIDELAGQNVEQGLREYKPDIVGLTATTLLAPDAYRIADFCRKENILTVMGGVHATILPEEALKHVDIVVKGEGELAMLDIVREGITSGIVSRPFIRNIDEIPEPARHLMDMDFYIRVKDRLSGTHLYFAPPRTRTGAILTARGCPYRCVFCHNSWRGMPVRYNSAERAFSEIKHLIERYNIKALFFFDDDIFAHKPRLKKICELMIQNKINLIWACQARVDHVDLETLRMAKEAGCRQIGFGFESGSQRILNILKKDTTTVEQNREAINLCQKAGIIPWGTFMIGNPTETIEDIRMTQQFIRQSGISSLGVHITTPFPGTELWQWCQEHNLMPESLDWSKFTTSQVSIPACDTISPEEIRRLFIETGDIISANRLLSVADIVNKFLSHPKEMVNQIIAIIKRPGRLINFLKRIKI